MRTSALLLVIVVGGVALGAATATAAPPTPASRSVLDGLGAADLHDVERAIAEITQRPAGEASPDALFAAARACEDKLLDPGRAAAIYDRLIADHPGARATAAAARRSAAIHELIGPRGETAAQAGALARLIARSDTDPPATVIERGDQLARAAWPGAPMAALWLADWRRRTGQLADALVRYEAVAARWPQLPQGRAALRGGAGCALEARAWPLAEDLAHRLATAVPTARAERAELLAAAARGRHRDRAVAAAWLAIAAAFAALLGSLLETALRSAPGTRWSILRPPVEILFLGPVAGVLIGVAVTAHRLIAPAVATIALGGLAQAWLSGAALDRLRAHGRPYRLRSVAHVVACCVGVAALGYVAMTRDNLLDMLYETVRFGPES